MRAIGRFGERKIIETANGLILWAAGRWGPQMSRCSLAMCARTGRAACPHRRLAFEFQARMGNRQPSRPGRDDRGKQAYSASRIVGSPVVLHVGANRPSDNQPRPGFTRKSCQGFGTREAEPFAYLSEIRRPLIDRARAAGNQLLLTPAPTVAALNRKKAMLASRRGVPIDEMTRTEAQKLIAADEAWLKKAAPKRRH